MPNDERDARLDPVRWRRPGRGTLIRAAVVAALLSTAAAAAWSRPTGCAPDGVNAAIATPPTTRPGASQPDVARHDPAQPDAARSSGTAAEHPAGAARRPAVPRGLVGAPVRPVAPAS